MERGSLLETLNVGGDPILRGMKEREELGEGKKEADIAILNLAKKHPDVLKDWKFSNPPESYEILPEEFLEEHLGDPSREYPSTPEE